MCECESKHFTSPLPHLLPLVPEPRQCCHQPLDIISSSIPLYFQCHLPCSLHSSIITVCPSSLPYLPSLNYLTTCSIFPHHLPLFFLSPASNLSSSFLPSCLGFKILSPPYYAYTEDKILDMMWLQYTRQTKLSPVLPADLAVEQDALGTCPCCVLINKASHVAETCHLVLFFMSNIKIAKPLMFQHLLNKSWKYQCFAGHKNLWQATRDLSTGLCLDIAGLSWFTAYVVQHTHHYHYQCTQVKECAAILPIQVSRALDKSFPGAVTPTYFLAAGCYGDCGWAQVPCRWGWVSTDRPLKMTGVVVAKTLEGGKHVCPAVHDDHSCKQ